MIRALKETGAVAAEEQSTKQVAIRVQPYLDAIRQAAVETLRPSPDQRRIVAGQQALAAVRDLGEGAGATALVEVADLVTEALRLATAASGDPTLQMGHYTTAIVADLTRVVHGLAAEEDPTASLEHARGLLRAMPRTATAEFVEVDLSDREQIARIIAAAQEQAPPAAAEPPLRPSIPPPTHPRSPEALAALREELKRYEAHVRELSRGPASVRAAALDALAASAETLQTTARDAGIAQVERIMTCVCRVLDAHRSAARPVTAKSLEFVLAGHRIIPMILESLDEPRRVARAVDALVEQSATLLIALHQASAAPEAIWPEPQPGRDRAAEANQPALPGMVESPDDSLRLIGTSYLLPLPDAEMSERVLPDLAGDATTLFADDAVALLPRLAEAILAMERGPQDEVAAATERLERTLHALRAAATAAGLLTISERCARMVALLQADRRATPGPLLYEAHALSDALEQVIAEATDAPTSSRAVRRTVRADVRSVEQLVTLASELAVRTGGHEQRSHRLGRAIQDLAHARRRLRDLARGLAHQPGATEALATELREVEEDVLLAFQVIDQLRGEFDALWRRQVKVLTELDDGLRRLRLVPFSALVPRLERAVLGAAREAGKSVRFVVDGGASEVDAALLDSLSSALLPLVRNAVVHGIEPPDVRRAAGKPEEGLVRLHSYRDGSQIVVQVVDDGVGIDDRAIAEQARASGFPVPAEGLTRDRALQLIFMPGFGRKPGTADGAPRRGGIDTAGMAVSEARGTITVDSEIGAGTTFTLRIPLVPSQAKALVVAVAGERYVLPFVDAEPCEEPVVIEPEPDGVGYSAMLGGERLPAVDLGALLEVRPAAHVQHPAGRLLRVLHEGEPWLIRVDGLFDQQRVMIRPLEQGEAARSSAPGVVGTTALPTGQIAQIVDLAQLLDSARHPLRWRPRQTGRLGRAPFVLIANSSISARRSLAQALERDGWRVLAARDGLEVRELLERMRPDLIVIDVELPLLDAFELAPEGELPVIGLLPDESPEARAQAEALGAHTTITKPWDDELLLRTARQVARPAREP